MSASRKARLRRRFERGGVAAIVAVLLGGGVLLGASALAIDVGNIMFERRQLQNGADAAVAKLARICADKANVADCDPTKASTISAVNNENKANAADNTASLNTLLDATLGTKNGMCGRVPGAPNLPPCPSATSTADLTDLVQCPPLPQALVDHPTIKYVETYTLTDSKGSNKLGSFFLPGSGATVGACSRMAWGPPGKANTLPLTFAECEYEEAINTVGFGNDPVNPADPYKGETALPLKYKKNKSCDPNTVSSGGDFDGGFGWLSANGCVASTEVPHWYDGQTGVGANNDCYDLFRPGSRIYIPIFTCISDTAAGTDDPCNQGSPSGTHTYYYITGYAAFYVTGVRIVGDGQGSFLDGYPGSSARQDCQTTSKDNKCIYGWFLSDWVDYGGELDLTGTVPDYGANVFKPVG